MNAPKKIKRNLFLHTNDLQKHILYPILIACAFVCFLALLCLVYFFASGSERALATNPEFSRVHMAIPWFLLTISFSLIMVIVWAYHISNKLVGPYERVLREMDEVLAGKRRNPIVARKGDFMFENLLKRINAIIDRLPE